MQSRLLAPPPQRGVAGRKPFPCPGFELVGAKNIGQCADLQRTMYGLILPVQWPPRSLVPYAGVQQVGYFTFHRSPSLVHWIAACKDGLDVFDALIVLPH